MESANLERNQENIYSTNFKRALIKAIHEEYPSTRHPEFKLPKINTKINPRAVNLDKAIYNENFEIVGRVIVTPEKEFVLSAVPTPTYDPACLKEQKIIESSSDKGFVLESRKGKRYFSRPALCCSTDDTIKAIRAVHEGKHVKALIEPSSFQIVSFSFERNLLDFGN